MVAFACLIVEHATACYVSPECQAVVPIRLRCARPPFMVAGDLASEPGQA
jgi:hypothetical protein